MKKLGLIAVVVGLLAVAPAVLAHAPLTGSACSGNKTERQISLHVHGMSCSAAYKALTKGSTKFTCKTLGNASKLPVTEKCFMTKHKTTYYEFLASGG